MKRAAARGVLPGEPGKLQVSKDRCRYCRKRLPKDRRNWCGTQCVSDFAVRDNPAIARARVLDRDHGNCAVCGRDTAKLSLRIGAWLACAWTVLRAAGRVRLVARPRRTELAHRRIALALQLGVRVDQKQPRIGPDGVVRLRLETLWDMDHITPVIEGGGGCGLENLRTLCLCCHKRATAELAARRATKGKR